MLPLDELGRPELTPFLIFWPGFLNWTAIIAAVWTAIKFVAKKAVEIAIIVAKAVKAAAIWFWRTMGAFIREVRRFAVWVGQTFRNLWNAHIRPVLTAVFRFFKKIQAALQRVFGPIVKFLKKVSSILTFVYDRILRPILNAIEFTRAILRLLGKLGLKWALNLERWLARLEARLFNAFLAVYRFLNSIFDWFDFLLEPSGLIRGQIFLRTTQRWAGGVAAVIINAASIGFERTRYESLRGRFPDKTFDITLQEFKAGRFSKGLPMEQAVELLKSKLRR